MKESNYNASPFTIALPSGRLAEESIAFFSRSGIAEFDSLPSSRILSFWDKKRQFRMLLVRSQDIPVYILNGCADVGITGRDVLMEGGYDLTVPLELNFGKCRLSLAAMEEKSRTLFQKTSLRVATKYPRLTADYFHRSGMNCEIINLHGSVEIAPTLSLADCIVDLVSTGKTLRDNSLVEMQTIAHFAAVLLVSRSSYALHTKLLARLINSFHEILRDES